MKLKKISRRDFLTTASAGSGLSFVQRREQDVIANSFPAISSKQGFDYRIAYGCWVNDMRLDPLALEEWPAPNMDEKTVQGVLKALDIQSRFGYNWLDAWGLLATTSWPLNIGAGVELDRRRRVKEIINAAHQRNIKVIYGMGTYSWGYEKIIENDPSLAARNRDGSFNVKALCDANNRSFEWVKKILDFVMSEFDFDGIHLESFDQGGCFCPQCAGKAGIVEYHCRINKKTAKYIRKQWPDKLINVIPIGWAMDSNERFTESDKTHIIELSRHIDGFYDQGWHGTYIPEPERAAFIKQLQCTYGTSGGRWVYPAQRWDRESFFIPHVQQQAIAIKKQYTQGVRGIMHYQGPVNNPGTEVNIACGGLMASDPSQDIKQVLSQVIEQLYQPIHPEAHQKLVRIFMETERAYFDQWGDVVEKFRKYWKTGPAGEFYMDNLFGDSPGPAGYLSNPVYLDGRGRQLYKKALISQLRQFETIEDKFNDGGRIPSLKRSMLFTLTLLNTIIHVKGEQEA
ncbi:MAG: hypothetical protein M9904_14700 [Chitinophagaceae bacterium]|nr:hypothetical protein [Chitinophagaceae bacterium]